MNQPLVKRFVAPSMTRALELVQQELGPEAVILSSQRVDNGVEIVTSLEPDLPTRGVDTRREFGQKFDAELDTAMPSDSAWRSHAGIEEAAAKYGGRTEVNGAGHVGQRSPEELAREIEKAREKMFAAKRKAAHNSSSGGAEHSPTEAPSNSYSARAYESQPTQGFSEPRQDVPRDTQVNAVADQAKLEALQNDIADMRMLLEQQMWQMSDRQAQFSQINMPQQVSMPANFSVLTQHLNKLGLSEKLVQELVMQVGHQPRASVAWRECMGILAKRLPVSQEPILEQTGVYAFLGQTGVGKTTTIAKLAAQYVLQHGAGKVALITTDTYRVGAFDQLRTMGRILNVPVRVVDAENSLLTVLSSLRQFPLILIDTAGFRLGDPLLKAQLDQLEVSPTIKRVLVMSCNSQVATMKASIHAHRGNRGLNACVLTKTDEAMSLGEALSLVIQEKLPVAYTTDGQDIPKDISQASGHGLVAKAVSVAKEQSESVESAAIL